MRLEIDPAQRDELAYVEVGLGHEEGSSKLDVVLVTRRRDGSLLGGAMEKVALPPEARVVELEAETRRMRGLLMVGVAVVEDFKPQAMCPSRLRSPQRVPD